jgi:peptidoglycan/xylan/chitin deacetylase (PgdA/CDA1 family)
VCNVVARLNHHLRARYPDAFWQGSPVRREIALTVDDGPDAKSTLPLLELLEELQVKATFFHVGQRARHMPHLVRQVAAAGHQIGLHGYEHRSFLLQSRATLLKKLGAARQVIADASGLDPAAVNAVRPPFGHFTAAILDTLEGAGYLPALWSLVPFHWRQSAERSVRQITRGVENGTILVLHEALRGPAVVELAQATLPQLLNDGYRFVTIDEMWASLREEMQGV